MPKPSPVGRMGGHTSESSEDSRSSSVSFSLFGAVWKTVCSVWVEMWVRFI